MGGKRKQSGGGGSLEPSLNKEVTFSTLPPIHSFYTTTFMSLSTAGSSTTTSGIESSPPTLQDWKLAEAILVGYQIGHPLMSIVHQPFAIELQLATITSLASPRVFF